MWTWKFRLTMFWYDIIEWLEDHEPVFCGDCGSLVFYKDIVVKQTLMGVHVRLCPKCHEKWFRS